MRKVQLKKWVIVALILINFVLAVIISGECDSLKLELTLKIPAAIGLILNGFILIKYGNLENRTDIGE